MKIKLFLFAVSFLLLACSNNDQNPEPEEQNTELKIKKFTRALYFEDPTDNYNIEKTFEESGKPIAEKEVYTDALIWSFSYNGSGLIVEKSRRYDDGPIVRIDEFNYNSNNQIENITFKDGQGEVVTIRYYTHENNKINYQQETFNGFFYYNTAGLITEIYQSGDVGHSTTTIAYSTDNIIQINIESSNGPTDTYSFEYDNELNPLHPYFHDNYFNSTIGDHSTLLFRENYFSNNNFTKITFTSSEPANNYTITKNTIYNENGYPLSAEVRKNDVLIEELAYEYY